MPGFDAYVAWYLAAINDSSVTATVEVPDRISQSTGEAVLLALKST